jgi:hypothetical protein
MGKHVIEYNYDTGNSFGTETGLIGFLELEWGSKEIAKENLKRIEEHYKWYSSKNSWRNQKVEDVSDRDWFVKEYDFCLVLKTDEGNDWQISAPWCGYFESLNYATIIQKEEDGMSIKFR